MPTEGRSVDDLPLAAYSTGVDPETEPDMGAEPAVAAAVPGAPGALALGSLDQSDEEPLADDEAAAPGERALRRASEFASRNPRVAAGGAFVTLILVGMLLLGGGGPAPSTSGASASHSAPPIVQVAADPGAATLVLTGALDAELALTGSTGTSPAGTTGVAATWTDAGQNALTLTGPLDRGTRTTDAGLVLSWTVAIDGRPVTFTSKAGECTIGMAAQPGRVTGSFNCHKVKSDDRKLAVDASGTYRT